MKEELKFLIINTSEENLTEIFLFNKSKKSEIRIEENRNHLKNLIPSIKEILLKENLELNQLDFISLNEGPGSWTGLRIGFATVKVLAMLSKIPLITFNNFELISNESSLTQFVLLIKCSETNYFYRHIDNNQILSEGVISEINLLENFSKIEKLYMIQDLELIIETVLKKYKNNLFVNPFDIEPMYLAEGVISSKK